MRLAIGKARQGIREGQAPFGACIVRGGKAVSLAHNGVWKGTDITAHAEICAIRQACKKLGAISLSGCKIYSTTEPCPMCFSAIHWSGMDEIIYGASIADAARCGFRELAISNSQMKRTGKATLKIRGGLLREECEPLFAEFRRKTGRKRLY